MEERSRGNEENPRRKKKKKKREREREGGSEEGKQVTKYSPQMVVGEHTEARKQRFGTAIGKSCYLI
jgi:hypothetical protein